MGFVLPKSKSEQWVLSCPNQNLNSEFCLVQIRKWTVSFVLPKSETEQWILSCSNQKVNSEFCLVQIINWTVSFVLSKSDTKQWVLSCPNQILNSELCLVQIRNWTVSCVLSKSDTKQWVLSCPNQILNSELCLVQIRNWTVSFVLPKSETEQCGWCVGIGGVYVCECVYCCCFLLEIESNCVLSRNSNAISTVKSGECSNHWTTYLFTRLTFSVFSMALLLKVVIFTSDSFIVGLRVSISVDILKQKKKVWIKIKVYNGIITCFFCGFF